MLRIETAGSAKSQQRSGILPPKAERSVSVVSRNFLTNEVLLLEFDDCQRGTHT